MLSANSVLFTDVESDVDLSLKLFSISHAGSI